MELGQCPGGQVPSGRPRRRVGTATNWLAKVTYISEVQIADTAHRSIRLDSLTSLRFCAAALVLAHHLCYLLAPGTPAWNAVSGGYIGVGFFFVLSGFVLTWTRRSETTIRHFYGRRVARVYPLHLATAAIAALLLTSWGQRLNPLPSFLNVFMLQSWVPHEGFGASLNGVSWSLSCEAVFYLCFPFLVRLVERAQVRTVVTVTVAAMLVLAVVAVVALPDEAAQQFLYKNPIPRMAEFVVGIALATAMRRGYRSRVGMGRATAAWVASYVAVLFLSLLSRRLGLPDLRFYGDLVSLPATCLLIAAAASSDLRGAGFSVLRTRWLVRLGEASFALYMVHYLLIQEWVHVFGRPASSLAVLAVATLLAATAIALSVAAYRWLERPLEGALRKRLGQEPTRAKPLAHDDRLIGRQTG